MLYLISRPVLVERLLSLRGAAFVTVIVRTDARCRKTNNPFGTVYKTAAVNGQVNFDYEAAVVRRLKKEGKGAGEFERGKSWHVPFKENGRLTPLACKKGESRPSYLRIRPLRTVGDTIYTDEAGSVLDPAAVAEFLPVPSSYANQGTDEAVQFKLYGLESIKAITLNGEAYAVA